MVFSLQHRNVTKKSRIEPQPKSRRWSGSPLPPQPSYGEEQGTARSSTASVLAWFPISEAILAWMQFR